MEPIIISTATVESTRLEYGMIVLTRDRRLLLFDDSTRGALQLGERFCPLENATAHGRATTATRHPL